MVTTQAHEKRTDEGRHGGHDVRNVDDDEIATSYADGGSHEEYD